MFYSGDFLTGVTGMDMEERGQYITLLCLQHAKGHLSIDLINRSVPNVSRFVLEKFVQDDEGLYFNIRLEEEAVKRNKFCKSRSENRKSKKDKNNICETHVEHMENENENVIIDVSNKVSNVIDNGKKQKKLPVKRTELAKRLTDEEFVQEMAKKGIMPCVKFDSPLVLLSQDHWEQLKKRFPVEGLLIEMIKVYNNWKLKKGGVKSYVNDFSGVQEGWVVDNAMKILNAKNSFTYDKMRKQQLMADEFNQSNKLGTTQFFNPEPQE